MTANLTSATPANQTSVTEGIPAEVMEHLHRHHVITLSTTSFTGMPHADTVVYMSDARSIFFFAGAETQMLRNIKDSRRVSFTIDDYTTDWRKVRELQGVGRCLPVRAEQDAEAWSLYLSKFGPEAARPPGFMHAIVPNEMHFVDYNYAKVAGRTTQIRRTFQIDNRAAAGARCGLDQPRPAGLRARPDRLPSGRLGRGVLRRSLIRRAAVSAGVTALVLGASAGAAAASTGTAARWRSPPLFITTGRS